MGGGGGGGPPSSPTVSDALWREKFKKRCIERARKDREKEASRRRGGAGADGMDLDAEEDGRDDDDDDDGDELEVRVLVSPPFQRMLTNTLLTLFSSRSSGALSRARRKRSLIEASGRVLTWRACSRRPRARGMTPTLVPTRTRLTRNTSRALTQARVSVVVGQCPAEMLILSPGQSTCLLQLFSPRR